MILKGSLPGLLGTAVGTTDITTTTTSYADMPAMSVTVVTGTRPLLLLFTAPMTTSAAGGIFIRLLEDSTEIHGPYNQPIYSAAGAMSACASIHVMRTPTAGSHTYKIQWALSSAGITGYQQGATRGPRRLTVIQL